MTQILDVTQVQFILITRRLLFFVLIISSNYVYSIHIGIACAGQLSSL